MKSVLNLFICWFAGHDWTTPFLERKCEVDRKVIDLVGVVEAFKIDNQMFCKRCGKVSHLHL